MLRRMVLAGFVASLGWSSALAQAPDGCWGGGGWGFGYWPQYSFYSTESVPYFSLHPPVYYSYPVPRTYGYSPFAYPPGVMTPEVVRMPVEQTLINPFVPAEPAKATSEPERTAQRVKVLINPFVTKVDEPALAKRD